MFLSSLKSYAKRKLLGSKTVINIVASFVESCTCTLIETIMLGSCLFVIKHFLSPFDWMDVLLVDIGCNVVYVLTIMQTVRHHLHPFLDKPCKQIARKILGLDIRNPWEFIKIKYTIMCSTIFLIYLFLYNINDVVYFMRLTCFEVFCIHTCVDVWTFRGKEISHYIEEQLEAKPTVKLLENHTTQCETQKKAKPQKQTPTCVKLDNMIIENHFLY